MAEAVSYGLVGETGMPVRTMGCWTQVTCTVGIKPPSPRAVKFELPGVRYTSGRFAMSWRVPAGYDAALKSTSYSVELISSTWQLASTPPSAFNALCRTLAGLACVSGGLNPSGRFELAKLFSLKLIVAVVSVTPLTGSLNVSVKLPTTGRLA